MLSKLTRCFISINLPDSTIRRVRFILDELKEKKLRVVYPANLHLTLKFLGEIKNEKIMKITELLEDIDFKSFKLKLNGVGAFPNKKYIRVVWIGAKGKGIENLHSNIENKLNKIYQKEKFVPHITVAKVNKNVVLTDFFKKYNDFEFGSFSVKSFEIMRSDFLKGKTYYSTIWSSSKEGEIKL